MLTLLQIYCACMIIADILALQQLTPTALYSPPAGDTTVQPLVFYSAMRYYKVKVLHGPQEHYICR